MLLNQFMRYSEIVNLIMQEEFHSILEVGSGAKGLGEYIPGSFVGCDLSLGSYKNDRVEIHPRMKPVVGDAISLPFGNRCFELVISSDMLEHIQPTIRERVIQELSRVASRVVILSMPCSELAFNYDRKLGEFYTRRLKQAPQWLSEHLKMGFATEEEIASSLRRLGLNFYVIGNENVWLHHLIMTLESYSRLKFKLAAVAELMNHQGDVIQRLSPVARIAQRMLRGIFSLRRLVNIGPTYRKIFVIHV